MNRVLSTIFLVLLLGATAVIGVLSGQRKLLYPAPPETLPAQLPSDVEKIYLDAGYGLLLQPKLTTQNPSPLLIYTHGNAEIAYWSLELFDALRARGFAILLVEYPGYGGAEGRPSYDSIQQTMLSAFDAMAARPDIDPGAIVAYGRSIGGAAASLLAAERPLAALGLESTFSSLPRLVKEIGWPAFLLRDRYDNEAIMRELDIPIFLYHGTEDRLIPIAHSESLATASKQVELVRANCGHNDCPRPWQELIQFLDATAIKP